MKTSLYQIEQTYLTLVETLEENGGETNPEMDIEIAINRQDMQTKGVSYGFVILQKESEVDIIDIQIKRLQALKKAKVNTIDRLKNNLSQAMQMFDVTELKTPLLKINFRKSESVEIEDIALLDADFVKTTITKAADKIAIKEAIKAEIPVRGAVLITNYNLQIK
jgi:hypothetical protein